MKINDYLLCGTLIVAFACKDGAVIVVDSRVIIARVSSNPVPYAYYNGVKKIYIVKGYLLAIAGPSYVNDNLTYLDLIDKFEKEYNGLDDLLSVVKEFRKFIVTNYPDDLSFLGNMNMVWAGRYENTTAIISCFVNKPEDSIAGKGAPDGRFVNDYNAGGILEKLYTQSVDTVQAAEIGRKVIAEYEPLSNYKVGGPPTIAKVDNNGNVVWMSNGDNNKYLGTFQEVVRQIKEGEIDAVFLSEEAREYFFDDNI